MAAHSHFSGDSPQNTKSRHTLSQRRIGGKKKKPSHSIGFARGNIRQVTLIINGIDLHLHYQQYWPRHQHTCIVSCSLRSDATQHQTFRIDVAAKVAGLVLVGIVSNETTMAGQLVAGNRTIQRRQHVHRIHRRAGATWHQNRHPCRLQSARGHDPRSGSVGPRADRRHHCRTVATGCSRQQDEAISTEVETATC